MSALAATFGICLGSIIAANPGINPNNLQVGQIICIPGPASCSGTVYTVIQGDTLSAIAARFGTTVNAILAVNPQICDENTLFVGEKICIPVTTTSPPTTPAGTTPPSTPPACVIPTCTNGTVILVPFGFSLCSISCLLGVSCEALATANPGINPEDIISNRLICLPATASPSTSCPTGIVVTPVSETSLLQLSLFLGIPLDSLMDLNPDITDVEADIGGMAVCIPKTETDTCPPSCGGFVIMAPPETSLALISLVTGIPLDALKAANPQITDPDADISNRFVCLPNMDPQAQALSAEARLPKMSIKQPAKKSKDIKYQKPKLNLKFK